MSPRIDHRPPVIAFLVLVVLAIAVLGTNARALDRVAVASDPLEVHAKVSGTTLQAPGRHPVVAAAQSRVKPVSRGASRPVRAEAAAVHGKRLHRGWERKARHHVPPFVSRFLALGRSLRLH